MAAGRQMASRPKLLRSSAPEDVPEPDTIDDDEQAATSRARHARRAPSTSSPAPAAPASRTPKAAPTSRPAPAKKRTTSSSRKPPPSTRQKLVSSSAGAAHDGAGVLLGMVSYALFLAYVKGGWSGVTGWLNAKFRNQTSAAPSSSTPPQTPAQHNTPPTGTPTKPSPFPVPQGPTFGVGGLYSP